MWLTTMSAAETAALISALGAGLWALFSGQRRYGATVTFALAIVGLALTLSPLLWASLLVVSVALAVTDFLPLPEWVSKAKGPEGKMRHWRQFRGMTQSTLALAFGLAALQYGVYVWQLQTGLPGVARPDVVDGFLPLAALLQLKGLIALDTWDQNHPAGLAMLLVALGLSIIVKRSFCGWACPLGWFGERYYQLRRKLWRFDLVAKLQVSSKTWPQTIQKVMSWGFKVLDYGLRAIKYYLLYRGVNMALNGLPDSMLASYLNGYYHKGADLKMFALFMNPSATTLIGLTVVLLLMALVRGSLCRYLCPFGALMAAGGTISPYKVRRDDRQCLRQSKGIDCQKCSQACPSRIIVHQQNTVWSDECNSCQRCVSACPVKGGINSSLIGGRMPLTPRTMLLIVLLMMFLVPLVLHSQGLWQSNISDMLRVKLWQNLEWLPMF